MTAKEAAIKVAQDYYIKTGFAADQKLMVKLIEQAILSFAREKVEEACIETCRYCQNGWELVREPEPHSNLWRHILQENMQIDCKAHAIRRWVQEMK